MKGSSSGSRKNTSVSLKSSDEPVKLWRNGMDDCNPPFYNSIEEYWQGKLSWRRDNIMWHVVLPSILLTGTASGTAGMFIAVLSHPRGYILTDEPIIIFIELFLCCILAMTGLVTAIGAVLKYGKRGQNEINKTSQGKAR